ncbi:MAG: DMT family transporter [Balneolales bacterium]
MVHPESQNPGLFYIGPRIVLLLIVGMTAFAFSPILVRSVGDTDPFAFAAARTVIAVLILLPIWLVRQKKVPSGVFNARNMGNAMLAGIFLGFHFIFWILALMNTSIASASILVTIHPVILILIEAGFMKRVFPALVWMGVMTAFSGSVLLGYSDSRATGSLFEHALLGDFYALIAAFLFAFYFLVSHRLRQKLDWLNYVFSVYGATAATCLLVAIVAGSSFPVDRSVWLAGLALAVGPQILGHGSMNYSVKYVAPTILATLILTEPVLASILALFIYSEVPPPLTFFAMGIIIAGIAMAWFTRKKHNLEPD